MNETKYESGTVLIATERYNGKFLFKGIRCEVESGGKKVKILDGPGKGRRLLADFSKLEPFVDQELASIKTPRFKIGDRLRALSYEQLRMIGKSTDEFNYGAEVSDVGGCMCRVIDVLGEDDYSEDRNCFSIEIEVLEGDQEGNTYYMLEDEFIEFYEKGGRKFRLSYLDEDGKHHVEVVEAQTLEAAREKVGPIKQEFYHIAM